MSNWEQSFKDYLLFETIMEAFDSPYDVRGPFSITGNDGELYMFDFINEKGAEVGMEIGFYPVNDTGAYEAAFKERGTPAIGTDPYSEMLDSTKGTKVLATVLKTISDFVESRDVNAIVYRAEPKRDKVYKTMFDFATKQGLVGDLKDRGDIKYGDEEKPVYYMKKPGYDLNDITLLNLR